jgi:hypothetical protein
VADYDNRFEERYFLETVEGRVSLHFVRPPSPSLDGAKVKVQGVQIGSALAVASGTSIHVQVTAAPPLPNTFGPIATAVILMNFSDKRREPFTVAEAEDVVFNQSSEYFRKMSYGQTWLEGDVYGWVTIDASVTQCHEGVMWGQARAKASAQFGPIDWSRYRQMVFIFPRNDVCGYRGFA